MSATKQQQMLDSMLEAAGAEGYARASVRAVLDRTGLYRQAFYDNFTDKGDCYLQAFEAGIRRLEGLMLDAAAGEKAWQGRLREGLGALLDFLDAEPDFGRGLIVEVYAAGPEALEKRSVTMRRIHDFLDQARGEEGVEKPQAIACAGVAGGIHTIVHSRLATGGDGFKELLPELMYFAVLPYFGAEAASAAMRAGG